MASLAAEFDTRSMTLPQLEELIAYFEASLDNVKSAEDVTETFEIIDFLKEATQHVMTDVVPGSLSPAEEKKRATQAKRQETLRKKREEKELKEKAILAEIQAKLAAEKKAEKEKRAQEKAQKEQEKEDKLRAEIEAKLRAEEEEKKKKTAEKRAETMRRKKLAVQQPGSA
jgi:hypothetical protein